MKTLAIASLVLAVALPCTVRGATVSTAFGTGADLELREHSPTTVYNTPAMNSRTSSSGDRNELIALRFDLSGYTLSSIADVSLSVISYRNDSSTRQLALYGVSADAVRGDWNVNNWSESDTTYMNMPGLLPADGVFTTQEIDPAHTTFLGQWPLASNTEGQPNTISTPDLTTFLQNYTGSQITFLIAQPTTVTTSGQARIASKEATALTTLTTVVPAGTYAPYLTFAAVPEPSAGILLLLGLGTLAAMRRRQ